MKPCREKVIDDVMKNVSRNTPFFPFIDGLSFLKIHRDSNPTSLMIPYGWSKTGMKKFFVGTENKRKEKNSTKRRNPRSPEKKGIT